MQNNIKNDIHFLIFIHFFKDYDYLIYLKYVKNILFKHEIDVIRSIIFNKCIVKLICNT